MAAMSGITVRLFYGHLQFKEYLERAEYIKSLLDGQQPAEPSANGATGQKMKPGGGGGGDKDVRAPSVQAIPVMRLAL